MWSRVVFLILRNFEDISLVSFLGLREEERTRNWKSFPLQRMKYCFLNFGKQESWQLLESFRR